MANRWYWFPPFFVLERFYHSRFANRATDGLYRPRCFLHESENSGREVKSMGSDKSKAAIVLIGSEVSIRSTFAETKAIFRVVRLLNLHHGAKVLNHEITLELNVSFSPPTTIKHQISPSFCLSSLAFDFTSISSIYCYRPSIPSSTSVYLPLLFTLYWVRRFRLNCIPR